MMKLKCRTTLLAFLLLLSLTMISVEAFSAASLVRVASRTVSFSSKRDDDFPLEEMADEYTGSVDWDAEWKKVVDKEKTGVPIERPGKDFYKSDVELAAIRAANKATTKVQELQKKLPASPSMNMRSFTGDWRVSWKMVFWINLFPVVSPQIIPCVSVFSFGLVS
jgi:hypothetical protein